MARILQDGFETEVKKIPSEFITGRRLNYLDVGEYIADVVDDFNYVKTAHGICSPRGGYGQKGYSIQLTDGSYATYQCCMLKYDLSKCCNDTSELFYRVWVKPRMTSSSLVVSETRITPIAITDRVIEKEVYNNTTVINKIKDYCNVVINMDRIDSNTYKLLCYCAGKLVYTYEFLFYDQWVKIDVRLKVGDEASGIFQLRINDKLITTFNGLTGVTNPKYLYIGRIAGYSYNYFRLDIDDIAVNDTTGNINNSWCGNGSIIGIVPTANGSKSMFTPGIEGTQNFENVDELERDGDLTYNSSYALNDIDLFKFTIPDSLGIPNTENINAISVITSAKFVEQPTDIGHIVSNGTSETLIGRHILSNDYKSQNSIVQEKSDGTKYKVSDIEGLEFGYKTLESSQAQEE